MISNELLSEVFGYEVIQHDIVNNGLTIEVRVQNKTFNWSAINIYELANKCKEWANLKGYGMSTHILTKQKLCDIYPHDYNAGSDDTIEQFEADIEPEAIFKACEWIMEQIR